LGLASFLQKARVNGALASWFYSHTKTIKIIKATKIIVSNFWFIMELDLGDRWMGAKPCAVQNEKD
jgi:hypothetical protein